MSSSRPGRPEPCAHENCGSRRFNVGEDGYTYCHRGHRQSERGTIVTEDTGELVLRGRKAKRIDSDAESTVSRASSFSGAQAVEHYLLCVQLVLWKQVHWLIHNRGLPSELEDVVKDLWALRLQKVQSKVSYDSETDAEQTSSSQAFSSRSESETANASTFSRRSRSRDAHPKEGTAILLDTLALCYIGILLLRIPVTIGDLLEWIHSGELLYYHASQKVPLGMRERLPGRYQALLDPQTLLNPELLHERVLELLTTFNTAFGMEVPAVNTPLMLYRWVWKLALPIETFAATQRLACLLDISGVYLTNVQTDPNILLRYPEAQVMALLVVATKLLFPFDNIKRCTESASDLPGFTMSWDTWAKIHDSGHDMSSLDSNLSFSEGFAFDESDCLQASDEALDAYLDWYEDNIASEEIRERGRAGQEAEFRRALFEMFPARPDRPRNSKRPVQSDAGSRNTVREVQRSLVPKRIVESSDAAHEHACPGSFYRRYRNVEDLPKHAQVFFERASKVVGLSMQSLVQAVLQTERKLQKHEERFRKAKL